jgi:hypothetical protein
MVKPIIFPYGKKTLNLKEYHSVLASSHFSCALFKEIHGGFSIRESIMFGCVPIMPNRNDYQVLHEKMYTDLDDSLFPMIRVFNDEMRDIDKTIAHYINNHSSILEYYSEHFDQIKQQFLNHEGVNENIPKIDQYVNEIRGTE